MSKPVVSLPPSPPWYWPVDVTRYDRSPDLNEIEQAELKRLMGESSFQLRSSTKERLHRLLSPLQDVFTMTHLNPDISHETVRVMFVEMSHRGKTFWAWSEAEWTDIIGPSYTAFARDMEETMEEAGNIRRAESCLFWPICCVLPPMSILCSGRLPSPLLLGKSLGRRRLRHT